MDPARRRKRSRGTVHPSAAAGAAGRWSGLRPAHIEMRVKLAFNDTATIISMRPVQRVHQRTCLGKARQGKGWAEVSRCRALCPAHSLIAGLALKRRWTVDEARSVLAYLSVSGLTIRELGEREGLDPSKKFTSWLALRVFSSSVQLWCSRMHADACQASLKAFFCHDGNAMQT